MKIKKRLSEIAEVTAGYPFRSGLADMPGGTVRVIQMRDISIAGSIDWSSTVRVLFENNMEGYYLRPGDIQFVMRGGKYYTALLHDVPGPTVSSMHFFRVRVTQTQLVLTDFLGWQLEQVQAQRYYSSMEAGTAQKSLRLGDFEAMEVVLPTLERQHTIMRAVSSIKQHINAMEESIANSESLLAAMAVKEFAI